MSLDAISKGAIGAKVGGDPIRRDGAAWDISTYTVDIEYKKPDDSTGTWPATVEGPDGNGDFSAFYTTTSSSDLDQVGFWEYRARVKKGATEDFRSKWKRFSVFD
jgi:hypothetical protein